MNGAFTASRGRLNDGTVRNERLRFELAELQFVLASSVWTCGDAISVLLEHLMKELITRVRLSHVGRYRSRAAIIRGPGGLE